MENTISILSHNSVYRASVQAIKLSLFMKNNRIKIRGMQMHTTLLHPANDGHWVKQLLYLMIN